MPPCCVNCNGEHTADSSACPRKAVTKTIKQKDKPTQPFRRPIQDVQRPPRPQSARGYTNKNTNTQTNMHPSAAPQRNVWEEQQRAREALFVRERELQVAEHREYSAVQNNEHRDREVGQQERPLPQRSNDRAPQLPAQIQTQVHPHNMGIQVQLEELRQLQYQVLKQQEFLVKRTEELKAEKRKLIQEQRALREQQQLWEARIQYRDVPTTPIINRNNESPSTDNYSDNHSDYRSDYRSDARQNYEDDLVSRLLNAVTEAWERLRLKPHRNNLPDVAYTFTFKK